MKNDKLEKLFFEVKEEVLDNGFKIIYYENPEFKSYYAEISTKYGSLDYTYLKNNKLVTHNPGIAHFLEHIMFNMPYGDAFSKFNEYLGYANAYTSYERTSYLVKCSENILENIKTLLDLVTTFYVDEQKVAKEKRIILEEVGLYDKDPDWSIFKYALKNGLENVKYNKDILGTNDDVSNMTLEMLEEAYNDFYKPNNQYIVIVGPKVQSIVEFVIKYMQDKESNKNRITKVVMKEKLDVASERYNIEEDVNQEYLNISYKYIFENKVFSYKDSFYLDLMLEMLFTSFNKKYIDSIDNGQIDYTFEYDSVCYSNVILIMFFIINYPENKFEQFIQEIFNDSFDNKYVESLINLKIGRLIKKFDDELKISKFLVELEQKNMQVKDYYNMLNDFKNNDIKEYLNNEIKKTIVSKIKNYNNCN